MFFDLTQLFSVSQQHSIAIAVLPFSNLSPNTENEYFCMGISEEIINTLSNIAQLNVTSRTSSFYFKDKQLPIKEIAAALNVGIILEGSVRFEGDKLRVSATLIDVENDSSILSRSWVRSRENIFEVQEDISISIADIIREQFGHLEFDEKILGFPTNDVNAYDHFLKAKFYHQKYSIEDSKLAISHYEKALEWDKNLIEAYIGIGDVYSFLLTAGFAPQESTAAKIRGYVNAAIELDKDHPGLNYHLASAAFFTQANFASSSRLIQYVVEKRPKFIKAQHFASFISLVQNNLDQAQKHLSFCLTLDPLNKETRFFESYFYYRKGDFNRSKEICQNMLQGNDKHLPSIITLSNSLLMLGETKLLLKNLETYDYTMVHQDELIGLFALANLYEGNIAEANRYREELLTKDKHKGLSHADVYLFYMSVYEDDFDRSVELLEKIFTEQSSLLMMTINDPLAGKFRADPRHKQYHDKAFGPVKPVVSAVKKAEQKLLDDERSLLIKKQLLEYMTNERPYLSSTITLRTLSSMLNVSPNILSWVVNEHLDKNFNEFINQYRLEHFKELLLNPLNNHISLLGLAYESGFNSKTVFNTFFKKMEGITPKAYQKKLSAED